MVKIIKVIVYRSSVTGKIVSKKFAEANPDTTMKHTYEKESK